MSYATPCQYVMCINRGVQDHQNANRSYLGARITLLELARRSHEPFVKQPSNEKRRLLNLVLSNCTWKDGQLNATYRQPF